MERTLSIIKPDAVAKGVIGKILDRFESNGLKIAATKKLQLSRADAEAFYAVHSERPFFNDLVDFNRSAEHFGFRRLAQRFSPSCFHNASTGGRARCLEAD